MGAVLLTLACAPEPPPEARVPCERFVAAWAEYRVRCAPDDWPRQELRQELRAVAEEDFFGVEGCAEATVEDFRDVEELEDQCIPALSELACDAMFVPDPCFEQVRSPASRW